jgi:hypothetical protein
MADPRYPDETLKALKALHEDLTKIRRAAKDVLEATDKHIAIITRVLNGAADQKGMDTATRKLYSAIQDVAEPFNLWINKYVRREAKTNTITSQPPRDAS